MTRTKTYKLVAILMAIFMAFAFMSFSLTYVSAEDTNAAAASSDSSSTDAEGADTDSNETPIVSDDDTSKNEETPAPVTKEAPTPTIDIPTYTEGAPDINVIINFGNDEPYYDYSKTTDTAILKMITENVKVYSRKDAVGNLSNEVKYTGIKFNNLQFKNNTLTFTVPLSKATGFSKYTTYYLSLGKELNRLVDVEGFDSSHTFTTKNITTTTTTRNTSYRTITTRNSTVKAKSANTGDTNELPVWIALASAAAIMMGAVYFSKEKE